MDKNGGTVVLGLGEASIRTTLYYNIRWRGQRRHIRILLHMKLRSQGDLAWYLMTLPSKVSVG